LSFKEEKLNMCIVSPLHENLRIRGYGHSGTGGKKEYKTRRISPNSS
jgi:hypothetical protein